MDYKEAFRAITKPIKYARRGTLGESKRPWRDGKTTAFVARLAEAGSQHSDFIGSKSGNPNVLTLGARQSYQLLIMVLCLSDAKPTDSC